MPDRILFVSRIRADPGGSGGQQRRHSLLGALRKVAEVDQLILGYDAAAGETDELYLPSLNRPPHDLARLLPFMEPGLLRLVQGFSEYSVRLSHADRAALRQRILAGAYDVIFCNRVISACVILAALGRDAGRFRIFTDLDDLVSDMLLARLGMKEGGWGVQTALAVRLEALCARWIERRATGVSRLSFVCSADDAAKLRRRYPGARVGVLPNVSRATFMPAPSADGLRLLFVGSLDYPPNRDGLAWFLDALWPVARARFGDRLGLDIVGRGSEALVAPFRRLPGIGIHLNVPDVAPYYREADACIVPIRYGGGTSIKTIEAMAAGRPVLSTAVGVRGLGLIRGEQYLGFEDADGFVAACGQLADDRERRAALAAAARTCWEEHFSQAAVDRAVAAAIG